jgi:hypothetical protein
VDRIFKIVYFLEVYFGHDDWQRRYIPDNSLMYVVISETEKYVSYGELQNLRCHKCGVAQTEVVITDLNCSYLENKF